MSADPATAVATTDDDTPRGRTSLLRGLARARHAAPSL
jgi:hypothetical protein